jgi:beta-1,4-N-acetylglucosaminyltransferase
VSSSIHRHHRKKAIICNFGTGGHTEQMKRLLSYIGASELILIAQSPVKPNDSRYGEYSRISKVRPDYASLTGILAIPYFVVVNLVQTVKLFIRFDIRMLISTGSGVAIIPSIVAKLFRAKVLFFESWSRFSVPSISGRIMYRIADVFFVQNEDIRKFYKKARYVGQL